MIFSWYIPNTLYKPKDSIYHSKIPIMDWLPFISLDDITFSMVNIMIELLMYQQKLMKADIFLSIIDST